MSGGLCRTQSRSQYKTPAKLSSLTAKWVSKALRTSLLSEKGSSVAASHVSQQLGLVQPRYLFGLVDKTCQESNVKRRKVKNVASMENKSISIAKSEPR